MARSMVEGLAGFDSHYEQQAVAEALRITYFEVWQLTYNRCMNTLLAEEKKAAYLSTVDRLRGQRGG